MKPPTFVECSVCGREFGSKSILIHERQCLQKLRRTEITPEQSSLNSKGTRRKKKIGTSSKSDHSALTTAENTQHSSKQITLPKIQTEVTSTKTNDTQSKKGIIRPATATLAKPKFLNLDQIHYDMSLTRIDYKTSTLKIMSDNEEVHHSVEELILPSVAVPSSSGTEKQIKKINKETPSITKLPQSTLATISSFFGAPLKKGSNGDGNEISLPRQSGKIIPQSIFFCSNYYCLDSYDRLTLALQTNESMTFPLLSHSPPSSVASVSSLSQPLLHFSSSTGFPVLSISSSSHTDLKRAKATHSTSLLDDTILPQISNDRSPDEPHQDALLTSAPNSINLPDHFQAERRRREVTQDWQEGLASIQHQGRNAGNELGLNFAGETDGTAQGGERQVGLFDQTIPEASAELVVLKEPVSLSDFESTPSTTEFVMDEHNLVIEEASHYFVQDVLEMCTCSDSEIQTESACTPEQAATQSTQHNARERNATDINAWVRSAQEQEQDLIKKSILKKKSLEDESSLDLTPGYFRERAGFNSFTGSDCDDEDESGHYGFLRQVSSLTLIKKSDSKKQCNAPTEKKKIYRNRITSRMNLLPHNGQPPEQQPTNRADEEVELVNQLTSLLHDELAKPKKRKGRFPRSDTVEEKVNDWLATCEQEPGEDPVSIWEGHRNIASNQARPSSSPAALHYMDEDEYGYDTDISKSSTEPSIGDVNDGKKKTVISGLLSAVFRIKELHKTRTYRFRDQMTVDETEAKSEPQDTVHIRRKKSSGQKKSLELVNPAPVPTKSKLFGQRMTQKLDGKTLKVLDNIERNTATDTGRNKSKRPQTAPSFFKPVHTKKQLAAAPTHPKLISPSGYGPPTIIPKPVASPTTTNSRIESANHASKLLDSILTRPVTSPCLKSEPLLSSSEQFAARSESPKIGKTKQVPKSTMKPKSKRPLTPRPAMKSSGIKFHSQLPTKPPVQSTSNQSSQAPEKRSKLVQYSPQMGRKLNSKPSTPAKLDERPCSPYAPPKSILKQLPKSKLVQFIIDQDFPESSRNSKVKIAKRNAQKHKPEGKGQSFLEYLSEPAAKFNAPDLLNQNDHITTHQIYQFETESKFGKPFQLTDDVRNAGSQGSMIGITSGDLIMVSSSSDAEISDSEFDASVRQPPIMEAGKVPGINPSEQRRQDDILAWDNFSQVEEQQNLRREKELEKVAQGEEIATHGKSRFKSTFNLLVPKKVSGDKLLDLNIIVRRRDEFSNYPPIEDAIPEFSTDWMYLIVDEVRLTTRSPNPYTESQVDHKPEYADGEYPLKITTSSLTTIGSVDEEDEKAKLMLTCYVCGHDLSCSGFHQHETNCKAKFLERNQFLDTEYQEYLPKKPQGTITISAWNRFAQQCTKRKRITCPFCGISFVPTEAKVAEHKASCIPLPRLTPIPIKPLLDNFGKEIEPPLNPYIELKVEAVMGNRDLESALSEQMRKRFNKKRPPKESSMTTLKSDDEGPPSVTEIKHKRIVVFVEKEKD